MKDIERIIRLLGGTARVLGREADDATLAIMAGDLKEFEDGEIAEALAQLRADGRFFTLAEILSRMPGNWPGPEEARTLVSAIDDESKTVVAPKEAVTAGIRAGGQGEVGFRMSFNEIYNRLVTEAKRRKERPEWIVSVGTDQQHKIEAVLAAVGARNLPTAQALPYLPGYKIDALESLRDGRTSAAHLIESQSHAPTLTGLLESSTVLKDDITREGIANLYRVLNNEPEQVQ